MRMTTTSVETKILVVRAPHADCRGTGLVRTNTCNKCGGTGEAGIAFYSELRAVNLEDSPLLDDSLECALECYTMARYGGSGRKRKAGQRLEDSKRGAYVYSVLQNAVDRPAMRTVRMLGNCDSVFNWLFGQEREHCPSGAEKQFTW